MELKRFGELLLLERLAEGGMAEVFRARQKGFAGFEKTVAIKRILPHIALSEKFKKLFQQEANLSATLQHNNITQVFNNGELEGYLYLVMEFVDGKNLRKLYSKAERHHLRIPIEISCFIVAEFLRGLDYAHNCKDDLTGKPLQIVHQDVSPQNIMLGYEGGVKVVDFGIAKATSNMDSSLSGNIVGKVSYMSPEQARGEVLDRRSDIFSSGIILWELLTQKRLYMGNDEFDVLEKAREGKIPRPTLYNPIIPYALERIVLKALEPKASRRYSSGLEFSNDLVEYLSDRHSNFVSSKFSEYMKVVFEGEIEEEKKIREVLHTQIPSFLLAEEEQTKAEGLSPQRATLQSDEDLPEFEEVLDTQISDVNVAKDALTQKNVLEEVEKEPPPVAAPLPPAAPPKVAATIRIREDTAPRFETPLAPVLAEFSRRDLGEERTTEYASPQRGQKAFEFVVSFIFVAAIVVLALPYLSYEKITETRAHFNKSWDDFFDPILDSMLEQSPDTKPRNIASTIIKNQAGGGAITPAPAPAQPKTLPTEKNLFVWEKRKMEVYGSLNISATPEADLIYIDGDRFVDMEYRNVSTPVLAFQISPGDYLLKIKNSHFGVSKTMKIHVVEGKTLHIEAILKK